MHRLLRKKQMLRVAPNISQQVLNHPDNHSQSSHQGMLLTVTYRRILPMPYDSIKYICFKSLEQAFPNGSQLVHIELPYAFLLPPKICPCIQVCFHSFTKRDCVQDEFRHIRVAGLDGDVRQADQSKNKRLIYFDGFDSRVLDLSSLHRKNPLPFYDGPFVEFILPAIDLQDP